MSEFKTTMKKPVINCVLSIVAGLIVFILLTSSASVIMLNVNIDSKYLFLVNYVISAVSVFVSGLISAHKSIEKKLIKGLLSGIILLVVFLFVFLLFNKYIFGIKLLLIIPVSLISCFFGCVAGINMKRK